MPRYSTAIAFAAVATATPIATIASSTKRVFIRQISISLGSSVLTDFSIYMSPSNSPVATGTVLAQPYDSNDVAALWSLAATWSTAPQVSSKIPVFREILPATIGAGRDFALFDVPLVMPTSSFIVIWNSGSGTSASGTIEVIADE